MDFNIRLANTNIAISSIYDEVWRLCQDYLTEGEPEMTVRVTPGDIAYEQERSLREAQFRGAPPEKYPEPYLETLAVYRDISSQMLSRRTFLMHGAVIGVDGRAWLFTAPSGTGKTTHIRLWLKNIPGSFVVNGDKPLINVGEEITVFGTPWAGKEGWQRNVGVKLCGIVFLERSAENSIESVSFPQAFPTLLQQSYRPGDKHELEQTLELLRELGSSIPLYRLKCNMDPEAALTAYNALAKGDG